MKEVKEVKMYICPETGKRYRSRKQAENSAAAAIKAKADALIVEEQSRLAAESSLEKKDWIRLNVTDVADIPKLIQEKSKEFWGIDCSVSFRVCFGQVSNSHGAPLGKATNWSSRDLSIPTSYLGWSGHVTGNMSGYRKNPKSSASISDVLFGPYGTGASFRGFHTGSGCPGDVGGTYPMDIGFYFFLEDFPLLFEKYELFKVEYQKVLDNEESLSDRRTKASTAASTDSEVKKLNGMIEKLNLERAALQDQLFKKYLQDNKVPEFAPHEQLENLKTQFKNYSGYGEFRNTW
jgi:hypothetical protein